jgi:hypothetical protein
MSRVLRAAAIVWLSVAMLNATAGVCLCGDTSSDARDDQAPADSCCQRHGLSIAGAGTSCCQIEHVPHTATASDVVVVAQPVTTSTPLVAGDRRTDAGLVLLTPDFNPSPPGRVLRV